MVESKPWYMSRTIWAALVSVAASFGAFAGFESDGPMRSDLTDGILQLVAAVAGITAVFGRLTAKAVIDR